MSHRKYGDSQINEEIQHSDSSSKIQNQKASNFHQGKWTDEQNLKYTVFMDFHKNIFISKQKRKSVKIFKLLSDYIQTRSPRQCRSHFQKIINKHQTIFKFRSQTRKIVGKNIYDKCYQNYTEIVRLNQFKIKNELFTQKISSSNTQEVAVQTDIKFPMFSQGSNCGNISKAQKSGNFEGFYPIYFWSFSEGSNFGNPKQI